MHRESNVEEVLDKIFSYLSAQPVLGHTNLQNIARIRLMLDLLDNVAIDNRDYVTMRLDEVISSNSLSQPNSLYMVRDSSEIDVNIEN